jgi:hypothetical protein
VSRSLGGNGPFVIRDGDRSRSVRAIPVTTDRVCESCNNGWLSVMENDCKSIIEPLLFGRDRRLTEGDQQRVAAWAYKTMLMLDMVATGSIPLGYFRRSANDRTAPASATIWLGAYIGTNAAMAYQRPLQMSAPRDELPLALLSTFAVGRLLLQVFHHSTKGRADLTDNRAAAAALDRIWPVQPAFTWPRQHVGFNDESLRELAGSIDPGDQHR